MPTVNEADAYFATRLNSDVWDIATDSNKTKALATAERQIKSLRLKLSYDGTKITHAIYEQAIWLLEGSKRAKLQQEGVKSASMGGMSETFKGGKDAFISPQARLLLETEMVKAVNIT